MAYCYGIAIVLLAGVFGGEETNFKGEETNFNNCVYRLRGSALPTALSSVGHHILSPRTCLGLARGEGWNPLITNEGGIAHAGDPSLGTLWGSVLAAAPLNGSSGRLFSQPPRGHPNPIEPIGRFLRHVAHSTPGAAKLCLVGDSMTRGLNMDFTMVGMHLRGLPASERERLMGGKPVPPVAYFYTNFGLDGLGLSGRHCHRLCKARGQRAVAWKARIARAGCTTTVAEPAAFHHAAAVMTSPLLVNFTREVRQLVEARLPRGSLALARHLDDVRRFKPLDEGTAREVAAVMERYDRVPASYRADVLDVAATLARWASGAPGRTAILRSPAPQMFPVTGEFTSLTLRSGRSPLKQWSAFATAQCGCQRLRPKIAHNTVLAQMARFVRTVLASNTSFAPVRFHDTYSALAYDHGLGYEGSYIGCFNVAGTQGCAGCAAGLRDSAGSHFRDALANVPPPTEREGAFIAAQADDFCDCSHVGFSPYRLATMVEGWLAAPNGTELATAAASARPSGRR
jgi:hypothetical protein